MKILNNFDTKYIANNKNKIFLAVALSSLLALLSWFPALRLFASKHPGLIGVLVAVSGEVYFDWKEESGAHSRWKKFFMALLVVSLSYELYEASESDKEAGNAMMLASKANERAAMTESNNLALEAEIQPRRITVEQKEAIIRVLQKWRFSNDKCEIDIGVEGLDIEAKLFAEQIAHVLSDNCGFKVVLNEGFNADIPSYFGTKFFVHDPPSLDAREVAQALKILPIDPITVETSKDIPNGIVRIQVSEKP